MRIDFGNRLRILRINNHDTQEMLAGKIGITKSTVSAYENNKRYPSLEILILIAQKYNVTTDYLLGINNQCSIQDLLHETIILKNMLERAGDLKSLQKGGTDEKMETDSCMYDISRDADAADSLCGGIPDNPRGIGSGDHL